MECELEVLDDLAERDCPATFGLDVRRILLGGRGDDLDLRERKRSRLEKSNLGKRSSPSTSEEGVVQRLQMLLISNIDPATAWFVRGWKFALRFKSNRQWSRMPQILGEFLLSSPCHDAGHGAGREMPV